MIDTDVTVLRPVCDASLPGASRGRERTRCRPARRA